jgi:signal transduction histidine kinase
MRESLHVRLVLWYALVLTLVVALYGGAVCYQSWRSMIAGVDRELEGYARELAQSLRPVDGGRFDLELTPGVRAYFGREADHPYYIIRSQTGELIDRSDSDRSTSARATGTRSAARETAVPAPAGASVLVGREITDLRRAQSLLVLNVVLAGIATLAVSICGGWFVAGRALAPIKRITHTALAMSAGDLDARIAVSRTETELEQVASTLNDAFDRLRLAVDQERRFTADASHELRTPISVLRAEIDWALERERSAHQYRDSLIVCRRAAARMQDLVERLLALARVETVPPIETLEPVPLRPLLTDITTWLAPLAHERDVRVSVDGEPLDISGNTAQLREALGNVVANAILYNKAAGSVTISTRAHAGVARIEVVDTGIGIPAEAIPRIFDRFFRVDRARSRERGGSGLGLSIARAIVEAHGGSIICRSEEGTGSVFVISLPQRKGLSELALSDALL